MRVCFCMHVCVVFASVRGYCVRVRACVHLHVRVCLCVRVCVCVYRHALKALNIAVPERVGVPLRVYECVLVCVFGEVSGCELVA